MSVYEVTDNFLKEVGNFDVTIMNLANGDMVGHTGVYEAAKLAVEHMDKCLTKIYDKGLFNSPKIYDFKKNRELTENLDEFNQLEIFEINK